MQNTVISEPGILEPGIFGSSTFDPIVFRSDAAPAMPTVPTRTAASGRKKLARTLLLKWDMIAVIALMLAGAVYGMYAVFFLTGF